MITGIIVVSAYDLESGLKLHYNKYFLSDLRQKSDEICQAHELNVLQKYNPNVKSQRLGPKEYRAALNGNSWKMALRVAIDFCMTRAKNKDEVQREMKKLGYDMVWTPERKYITYICPTKDGKERKQREEEAERPKKEQEILATWFLHEEYINAGWFKHFLLRLQFAFRDTRGESKLPPLPDHLRMEIARCILPDIVAYFESERGQREFAEWKAQQEAEKKEQSEVA